MKYQNEEARKLYEGKWFYIVDSVTKTITKDDECNLALRLQGPFEDIYYVSKNAEGTEYEPYTFVWVVDGIVVQFFTKEEVLVTDRLL